MKHEFDCDRCGNSIQGMDLGGMTAGYYATPQGSFWAKCADASPNEQRICDSCMWASPGYKEVYGEVKAIKETGKIQPSLSDVSGIEREVVNT